MDDKLILAPHPRVLHLGKGHFRAPRDLGRALDRIVVGVHKLPGVAFKTGGGPALGRPEGYRLSISEQGILAQADTAAGFFYAAVTLRQILRQSGKSLPCLEITDWPDYPARGVMLDISRDKVPTMATLFRIADFLAEFKVNQFQLYIEHTFAYRAHREVWKDASPMTGPEIRRFDEYCRRRNIELVPNQNSFGHMERWLKHARYKPLAEAPDGWTDWWGNRRDFPFSLNPSDPGSLRLMASLYDELLPHFKSRLFNAGCDETFDLGQGKSRQICTEKGTGRVYLDFLLKIHEEVKKHGRTMQFWGDIILRHPELIPELPRDLIALNWGYEADHKFDEEAGAFAASGIPFYVCPGTSSWNTLGGRWDNGKGNLLNAAENGMRHGAIGYLNTDWGDNGHFQQLPISFPGYLYGAAVCWDLESNRALDVEAALSAHFFRDASGELAKSLLLLGNAYLKTGVLTSNSTVFFHLLLEGAVGRTPKCMESLTPAGLQAAMRDIESAIRLAEKSAPRAKDAALLKREVLFAAGMQMFSARLGLARVSAMGKKKENIPAKERKGLAREFDSVIKDYRVMWLARNRRGGLADSVARLDKLREWYFKADG